MPVAAAGGSGPGELDALAPRSGTEVREALIRRSAPISPTCPTACASCARHAGSRYGNKVEPAGVVGAVTRTTAERHDTERIAAAAERARDQMGRVDPVHRAADDARPPGDRGSLGFSCGD
jgi:hypothetical protein